MQINMLWFLALTEASSYVNLQLDFCSDSYKKVELIVAMNWVLVTDVYLFGTVLLIFGMGVYGLFISNVSSDTKAADDRALQNTSLFGLFLLKVTWTLGFSLCEQFETRGSVPYLLQVLSMEWAGIQQK